MYIFEISDILFFIKNLKNPTNNFSINTYISFSVCNTRSHFLICWNQSCVARPNFHSRALLLAVHACCLYCKREHPCTKIQLQDYCCQITLRLTFRIMIYVTCDIGGKRFGKSPMIQQVSLRQTFALSSTSSISIVM